MGRNYGFPRTSEEIEEQNRLEFWTGFITGGISAAATFLVFIVILLWWYPTP